MDERKNVKVPDSTWNKLREISWEENFHMYEIVQALVEQYWQQMGYIGRIHSNEYNENNKALSRPDL